MKDLLNKVITVKLRGSEELICKLNDYTDDAIFVNAPLQIIPMGNGQISFLNYVLTVDDSTIVSIPRNYIVFVSPTMLEVEKVYLQRTTGIDMSAMVQGSSIITG